MLRSDYFVRMKLREKIFLELGGVMPDFDTLLGTNKGATSVVLPVHNPNDKTAQGLPYPPQKTSNISADTDSATGTLNDIFRYSTDTKSIIFNGNTIPKENAQAYTRAISNSPISKRNSAEHLPTFYETIDSFFVAHKISEQNSSFYQYFDMAIVDVASTYIQDAFLDINTTAAPGKTTIELIEQENEKKEKVLYIKSTCEEYTLSDGTTLPGKAISIYKYNNEEGKEKNLERVGFYVEGQLLNDLINAKQGSVKGINSNNTLEIASTAEIKTKFMADAVAKIQNSDNSSVQDKQLATAAHRAALNLAENFGNGNAIPYDEFCKFLELMSKLKNHPEKSIQKLSSIGTIFALALLGTALVASGPVGWGAAAFGCIVIPMIYGMYSKVKEDVKTELFAPLYKRAIELKEESGKHIQTSPGLKEQSEKTALSATHKNKV